MGGFNKRKLNIIITYPLRAGFPMRALEEAGRACRCSCIFWSSPMTAANLMEAVEPREARFSMSVCPGIFSLP